MDSISQKSVATNESHAIQHPSRWYTLRAWLLSWELYVVIFAAAFLRLYSFGTTEFSDDQANVFHMAYEAVSKGYLVATSNVASIGIYNPPGVIYFFMLPAALKNDPLWGAIAQSILMIVSVILTYVFVRRYYGRTAATIAALTYATAFRAVIYSRFIWNQNLLPFFIILLFLFLFVGIYDRKKGWFWPAVLILGLLVQFHATGIYFALPLALAVLMVPKTIRKRDIVYAALAILITYAPYLIWEVSQKFIDVKVVMNPRNKEIPYVIDGYVWQLYKIMFNPYDILASNHPLHWKVVPFLNEQSQLWGLAPYLAWIGRVFPYLIVTSIIGLAGYSLWLPRRLFAQVQKQTRWKKIVGYWQVLCQSPERCGLILLLVWQTIPALSLLRHQRLFLHYLIFLLPGMFILFGIFVSKLIQWVQQSRWQPLLKQGTRYGLLGMIALIVGAQFLGSMKGVEDLDRGSYQDGSTVNNYYSDLRSLRATVHEADAFAQQKKVKRLYIASHIMFRNMFHYLEAEITTSTSVFSEAGCLVLPSTEPAVLLTKPLSNLSQKMLNRYATVQLLGTSPRPGGEAFRIYYIQPKVTTQTGEKLGKELQLVNTPEYFTEQDRQWLVSRWNVNRPAPVKKEAYRETSFYTVTEKSATGTIQNSCQMTSAQTGDQILFPQGPKGVQADLTTSVTFQMRAYEEGPRYLQFGPLTLLTFQLIETNVRDLKTEKGASQVEVKRLSAVKR